MSSKRRIPTVLGLLVSSGALTMALFTPSSQAERMIPVAPIDAAPVTAEDILDIETRLRTPSVIELARATTTSATQKALTTSLAQSEVHAMAVAREHITQRRYAEAQLLLLTLLEKIEAQTDDHGRLPRAERASSARVRMLLARALNASDRPDTAIEILDGIEDKTPIDDYKHWLRAQSFEALGKHMSAYKAYKIVSKDKDSPMAHRARVARAHALFAAQEWEAAIDELEYVNETYTDYPRRHRSMHEYAIALDKAGKLEDATLAYQKVWFDYPFKERGKQAKVRMDELVKTGYAIEEHSFAERYARYRMLRINKHWDTARDLFIELSKEIEAEEGEHAEMVHQIWLQLALNAYIPKRYEEALYYLQKLKAAYESGNRDGVYQESTYKYLAIMLAKFGKMDEALKELDRAENNAISRLRLRAEFLADHGRYKDTLEIYETISPPGGKRGWHYTWLLYKTANFEEAYTNLMALAARSSGRNNAKYSYWAARTLERWGKKREAKKAFEEVWDKHPRTYYGLQAHNRLDDMQRRATLDSTLLVETDRVTRSGDEVMETFDKTTNDDRAIAQMAARVALEETSERTQPRHGDFLGEGLRSLLAPTICGDSTEGTRSSYCNIATSQGAPTAMAAAPTSAAPEPEREAETVARGEQRPAPVKEDAPVKQAEWVQPGPRVKLTSKDNQSKRIDWATEARIFWEGRDKSALAFERYDDGEAIGPHPADEKAYGEDSYIGGLDRAIKKMGHLFPKLERAKWLQEIGLQKQARWAIRDVSMEFRELYRSYMPSTAPIQLRAKRMTPLIDNRRVEKSTWGYIEEDFRWPVPSDEKGKKALLERQREIIREKRDLRPVLVDAMKEVGDYYMVRRYTLDTGIRGSKGRFQVNPRAFPDLVIPEAKKWGVNPYLVWSLMTVESSYNPDSVSRAEALGLLQVIPRTGLKTAELLHEEDFGHYDLLDEDVAVRHGVFYFSRLVRKFHGQELFAIAGYNGGPHRVAEWIDMRGDMPMDEFVEEIPYDQAREYTKKVLRFMNRYWRYYEGIDTIYIGQKINRTWRPMPNF